MTTKEQVEEAEAMEQGFADFWADLVKHKLRASSEDIYRAGFRKALSLQSTGWVDVCERLPEYTKDKTHLVYVWIRDYPRGYAETAILYPDKTWGHLSQKQAQNVTHWQEITPPTSEREAKPTPEPMISVRELEEWCDNFATGGDAIGGIREERYGTYFQADTLLAFAKSKAEPVIEGEG